MPPSSHRVWAEIDLPALRHNFQRIALRLTGGARVLAVVKADAYGHGAVPVARALAEEPRLWGFGVGDSQEALELVAAGLRAPVLILGTIINEEVPQVVSHGVRVCIHSMDRIRSLEEESARQGRRTRVHLMVDTGMGRLGALPPRALELARAIVASPWLELEGLATHAAPSRPGHPFAAVQHGRLAGLVADLAAEDIAPPVVHFANTAAILGGLGTELPVVRPGISLYGVAAPDVSDRSADLEPVMSLRTQVVYLKDVPAGTPIGYNGTHVTSQPTRVATLPIGYNDGLAYRLSNRGRALVRGRLAPIVGAISMDYTTLDVGLIPDVSVGDTVTLIGKDGERSIGMPEVASLIGTIPYEVACSVGKRVARVYLRDERPETAGAPPEAGQAGEGGTGGRPDAGRAEAADRGARPDAGQADTPRAAAPTGEAESGARHDAGEAPA